LASNAGSRAFQKARLHKQHRKEADALLPVAAEAYRAGRHADVEVLCQRILENLPGHFGALFLLGMSQAGCGRPGDAEASFRRATEADPRSPEAHANLGVVLFDLKRFAEARKSFEKAVALKPNYPIALNSLGNALMRLGLVEQALDRYNAAIALKPDHADAYVNRGMALLRLARSEAADADFDRALRFRPGYLEAIVGKGLVQAGLRHSDQALATFETVLAARPAFPEALVYRAQMRLQFRQLDKAAADFDAALAIDPDFAAAWIGKAKVSLHDGDIGGTIAACEQALQRDPHSEAATVLRGICFARQGHTAEAIAYFDRVLALNPEYEDAISKKIFALDFASDAGFEAQQAVRRQWWDLVGMRLPRRSLADVDRDPDRRLVVGYVSADFKDHSAALTFKPVLRHHDRTRFEIVCYSGASVVDAVTDEFRRLADKWRESAQLSDDELADRIQADKVDILVDLSGHTDGNRLGVFARKPAPVQVTAWGMVTGTGVRTIDYIFADPVTVPQDVRPLFAERIHDLPSLITLEQPQDLPPSALPMIAKGHVTFGVFNRVGKISDHVLGVWKQLLDAIPLSRIVIKDSALDDALLRTNLMARFVRAGVAPDRVSCLGATTRREHLLAFADIDIALDPFPQNGGVSTWEALHMGVPVVAKLGAGASSRAGGAIVTSIGLGAWVAQSDDDYIAIAQRFASKPDELAALRAELPARIAASQSGNVEAYTRRVEQGYRQFWRAYCAESRYPSGGEH
jgi:predicted O-linked N-acetylglucosamine transferase (SPINDLY family)